MEEELPYKLLTLSHCLQCFHQLSLPLLTVHYTKYSVIRLKGLQNENGNGVDWIVDTPWTVFTSRASAGQKSSISF